MSKEKLRTGLESWIKDTRKTIGNLDRDPAADEVDLHRLDEAVHRGSDEELDDLAERLADDAAALARKVEVLRSVAARISAERLERLDRSLERLTAAGPPPEAPAADASGARGDAGPRRIAPSSFGSEVLDADAPVLVNLVLEGHAPCLEARQALRAAREIYGGDVKLCDLDVLAADEALLPHLVKLGRDFLVDNLPAVLLFWEGGKVAGVSEDVDAESLAELIRSNVGILDS